MAVQLDRKRSARKSRKKVNIHQNSFEKGYISTIDDSRRPLNSLSDATNIEIVQDNVPRPRPPLVRYGTQPTMTIIGRANVRYSGSRSIYWMMNNAGTGQIYRQTDGGSFTSVGGTYDDTAWAMGVQSKARLYICNGVDNLTYVDLTNNTIAVYIALSTPSISSVTQTGMAGTTYTHYYRVSANNSVGESIASAVGSVTSLKVRDDWVEGTDYVDVTWGTVTNATSYTIYYGDSATTTKELYTVSGNATVTFRDLGTLAVNPFKLAPEGNSTEGAIFTWMYVDTKNGQVFGITTDNFLYYSAPGSGDFSPYNGGGYVPIDEDGDSQLNFVTGFRTGKGDPVITVSARGAAGKGKLYHVTFETLTVGDQSIVYPNVFEANGQSGTYAPRATVKANDDLIYPTGQDFRNTGTSQNIVNVLTNRSISQVIEPDVENITLSALDKAVGLEYKDRVYFALPVGSATNNEIWYLDLSRKNLWMLRWPINATDMWLYEDNDGKTHFCVLVNNVILEFKRAGSQTHQDDGVAWRSRAAFEALVWDEDGISLAKIRRQYFKLLYPKGEITTNAYGISRTGLSSTAGSDSFQITTTPTGYDVWVYDEYQYDVDPGEVNTYGKSIAVLEIKPKGLVNQLSWEVVGETAGTDYILSAANTRGTSLEDLVLKTG